MKKIFPNYRETGLDKVRENLKPVDKRALKEYLDFVKTTAGEEKLKQYEMFMLEFIDIVEKPLNRITKKDAEEFWGIINHSEKAVPTKNLIRLVVKRFLKWHYKDLNMLENLHMQKHLVDKNKVKKANLITPKELELLLRNAGSFRNKAIISLLYESAGRPEEVRKLKWKDINFENKTVNLYSGKTKQAREVPIDKSISWLEAWKKDYQFPDIKKEDFIFPNPYRDSPLSGSFFTKLIKRLARKSGIERTITPYWFRRSRLTELYNNKVGDIIHRKFAGHTADSKMTSVYVAMDEEDMQNAVKSLYNVELTPEKKDRVEELEKEVERLRKQVVSFLMKAKVSK